MEETRKSPARKQPVQGVISFDHEEDKDMNKIYNSLSSRQKKVFDLLCTGKQSVTDITIALGYADPRSYVRDLKSKGVIIHDEWVDAGDGVRFKRHWIESDNIRTCETLSLSGIPDSPDFNKIKYDR